MAFVIPRKIAYWGKYPDNPEIDYSKSINDELTSFYIFDTNLYGRNIATGEDDQITEVGTGVNFLADGSGIETKNSTANYIYMPTGTIVQPGVSAFFNTERVAGVGLWSWLNATSNYDGFYATDQVIGIENHNFGSAATVITDLLTPSGLHAYVWSYGTSDLRGISDQGLSTDTSFAEINSPRAEITFGALRRSSVDNASQTKVQRCGFYSRVISDDEKFELKYAPYQGLKPRRSYWVMPDAGGTTATLTGTITTADEADIVAGGKTIILTLTDDTWVAAGATFDAQRQPILDGLTSAQTETTGWNNEVRDNEVVGAVVRTSDTVVTITWTAAASYDITANETIEVTIPAAALVTSASAVVATPTFTVSFVASGFQAAWAARSNNLIGGGLSR